MKLAELKLEKRKLHIVGKLMQKVTPMIMPVKLAHPVAVNKKVNLVSSSHILMRVKIILTRTCGVLSSMSHYKSGLIMIGRYI